MDSSDIIDIKQEDKETEDSHLVIESQSQTDEDDEIDELGNDGESPVDIHNETIGQHSTRTHSVPTSTQSSPDQLNDLQSYLVTFNKEIGHGGQPTGYTIGELDASNLASQTRQVLYNVGGDQLLNVATSLHANQDLSGVSGDTKVEITMTASDSLDPQSQTDGIDPQSETLKLAESLSNSSSLLQQNAQVVSHDQLSTFTQIHDQQRTIMLQGLPGAPGTLVQVDMPGTSRQKVVPVVSLDGKEQMQLLDSVSTVVPQILHVSETSGTIAHGIDTIKTDVNTTVTSSGGDIGSLQGIQIGQADITNAQLIALQNPDNANAQLVAVSNPQDIQMLGTSDSDPNSSNFQTVTIVPTSVDQGGEMNYVLIVSHPDGEKEGTSPKQFALDMGMFDFKDGREVIEEVVDEEGNTRKIIRVNPKKFEMVPSTITQLQCHYCSYTAPKRYLLMRHMKTHSEDRPYQCNLCEKSFKTHASLQNHVNTHTGVRPHKCKDCEMAFTTSGELVRHIRYKHTFEKPHKCTECDYASVELSKLKRHIRSHTGERPYQCPHCQYASPDTYKLKRHLRIHTGEKPYQCDVCHARFTQSNSLKAHKLIHSGLKPVFQCELCPTTCGRKTDLKIHMMKLHSNDKPVDCKKCGMCFQDRYSFKLHLKTHDGEKCFKCDQCEYAALSQRHLESHLLTHTGEKPFECDECEQTFRQKQLLKRHKNLYHTPDYNRPEPKEKNFDCNLCDKLFANRGNLLRHMQNHDPEYWNKKLSEGSSSAMSTDDLIQGSLLNDMREGKLGAAPKVVIVHPNGSVEEVTSRLQNLVAEKQMEEMMVEVVQENSNSATVTTQSLEEAIRTQVEAAIQSHAIKTIEMSKTNNGEESATDNLTIDLDRQPQKITGTSKPKETFSRQDVEMDTTGNQLDLKKDHDTPNWKISLNSEHLNKIPDHVIVVKPKDKREVLNSLSNHNEQNKTGLQAEDNNIFMDETQDENQSCTMLSDHSELPDQSVSEIDMDDNPQS